MTDLISREAAIDALNMNGCCGMGITYLLDCDSVPAVPLDKLCEWLAERYEPPYALIDIDKLRRPIDFRQQKEIWMAALTKWMEEQDANRE